MHFWGMLLGGVPNLLIAVGLIVRSSRVALGASRLATAGFVLVLIGLIVPAGVDLSIRALGAPFFVPILAIGLVLLVHGVRANPRVSHPQRVVLLCVAISLIVAFTLALLPSSLTDPLQGYRIYGVFAHVVPGVGWTLLGVIVLRDSTHDIEGT